MGVLGKSGRLELGDIILRTLGLSSTTVT